MIDFRSERVLSIKESPTLAVTGRAARMIAAGHDVISLGAGEPDFDTPEHIKLAGIKAIETGKTKYTAVGGIPQLKDAIIDKLARDNQLSYTRDEIVVTVGAKQALFNLAMAVLNKGDEVIIPAPYWVSYSDIAIAAEAKPVLVRCGIERGFKITPEQLRSAITPQTKLLFLNSPSNPTGVMYSETELKALGEILLEHPRLLIISDDIYEHIRLDDSPFVNILMANPALKERVIIVNGVSKAYAMTGWRIGYAAGPQKIIKAAEVIQSQSTSSASSMSQYAAVAALTGDQSSIATMLAAFKARHNFIVDALDGIDGVRCIKANGAFYAFPDAREVIKRLAKQAVIAQATDMHLAEYLLEQHNVAVVPGSAFGAEGYFRISFATSMDALERAVERLRKALSTAAG